MRRVIASLLLFFALVVGDLAGQTRSWGVGLDVGLTRFWGASEPIAPNDVPGVKPYRPTTVGVRLDRVLGQARVGVGLLYAASALGQERDDLALVAKGSLSWIEAAPELAYQVATLGPLTELRLFAGPVLDFWLPEGDASRFRAGARAGIELLIPLGSSLAGTLRAHGGVSGSLFRDAEVPSGFRAKAMPNAGVALGLRLGV